MKALAQSTRQNKFFPTTNSSNFLVQRKCACGGASKLAGQCSECEKKKLVGGNAPLIQPKLKIGQPNDKYEQEADRVADEVMRMPEPNVQRQVGPGEDKEVIQKKPISGRITPLVQRQEPEDKPKSNGDKAKEALEKTAEAFLETAPGKAISKKAEDVVTSLPGAVITGTTAVGVVSALIATNKELPIQAPAIPLEKVYPGLSMKITVEGPLRAPTNAMISFSGIFGLAKPFGRQKPVKTESEKLREDSARMQREQFEFRESLKTPEEKARDQDFLNSYILQGMNNPSNPLFIPGLKSQKDAPAIEKKKEELPVQRKETNSSTKVGADTAMVLGVTQSAGQPLDAATRSFMEPRFGHDFSQVKIHIDDQATASAKSVNARAYTLGQNIVFGAGQYLPGTTHGGQLLAHELTHVLQQSGAGSNRVNLGDKNQEQSITPVQHPGPVIARKKPTHNPSKARIERGKKRRDAVALFWSDIHDHFPEEGRKLAGSGFDDGVDYLTTSFQEGDVVEGDVKTSRSAPIVYVGNKYLSESDTEKRKAVITVELGKIDKFRFNKARIDNADLSNPVITAKIGSLDIFGKRDYLQKLEAQTYIENEKVKESIRKTMPSTQLEQGAVATTEGGFTLQFENIKIVIKPDVFNSSAVAAGEAHTELKRIDSVTYKTKPGFNWGRDQKVSSMSFTPSVPQLIYKVETHYGPQSDPSNRSGYGVGTRPEDLGNKSLRFHEGMHGTVFIQFIKNNISTNSFPTFDGSLGEHKDDFGNKVDAYEGKVIDFDQMLKDAVDASEQQVDCVGKTIEHFHTEKGTTSKLKCKTP